MNMGNNLSSGTRFGKPKISLKNKNKDDIELTLPAGSFLTNTVHRQCVIRMASGVDVVGDKLFTKEHEQGKKLAQNYILQGGVLKAEWTDKGSANVGVRDVFREGRKGTSYADKSIRSDASSVDGYGIVPMPGIIDATIETRTAYGSLRTAKVNFTCHNRRQLEVLEVLYMRPGMPILLEWGWMPFINNDGKRVNNFPFISDEKLFWDENTIQTKITSDIRKKQVQSGGNYDGFLGFCKNFEMVSRPDGGYDCTTEIVAMGEVLEGLKAGDDGDEIKVEQGRKPVDTLEFFLEAFLELGDFDKGNINNLTADDYDVDASGNDQEDYDTRWDPNTANMVTLNSLVQKLSQDPAQWFRVTGGGGLTAEEMAAVEKNYTAPLRSGYDAGSNAASKLIKQVNELRSSAGFPLDTGVLPSLGTAGLDRFFQFKGTYLKTVKGTSSLNTKSQYTYIRWDFLCHILNYFVLPQTKPEFRGHPICKINVSGPHEVPDGEGGFTFKSKYFDYTTFKFPENDPRYDIFRKMEIKNKKFLQGSTSTFVDAETVLNGSYNPTVCLFPNQIRRWKEQDISTSPESAHTSISMQSIGAIHFNVEYLKRKYVEMAYNNDGEKIEGFGLFDWIQQIWKDANAASVCDHNFILQTQPDFPNNVRILDLQVDNKTLNDLKPEDLFEVKIQGNKSIVREFNYNTTIPSGVSATIAVAAQAPSNISDLDAVTFANFSKGIKSRFTQITEEAKNENPTQDPKLVKKYNDHLERIAKAVGELVVIQELIELQDISDPYDLYDRASQYVSQAKSCRKSIQKILQLVPSGPNKGKKEPIIPAQRSAVVPLKFNAKMDGIGGIVIGNVFKVEKEKLPIGYQSEDIGFAVMTESQTITSGQDWTTEISGMMILLDLDVSERNKWRKS